MYLEGSKWGEMSLKVNISFVFSEIRTETPIHDYILNYHNHYLAKNYI